MGQSGQAGLSGREMPPKYFTPEEANALLPRIRELMGEIFAARDRILSARPEILPVLEKAAMNGGNRKAGEVVQDFEKIERGIARIHVLGAQVRDISRGLVDFPYQREGQDVLLCWQYGEEKIEYWHDEETGFRGRQPL